MSDDPSTNDEPAADAAVDDVTATHVLTDVPSAPDVPADDAPDVPSGDGTVWICPGCGARYTENVTCTIEHEPLQTEPATVPADEAAAATAPPADDTATLDEAPVPDPDKVAAVAAAIDTARTAFDELARAVADLTA